MTFVKYFYEQYYNIFILYENFNDNTNFIHTFNYYLLLARHGQNGSSAKSDDEVTNDTSMINDKPSTDDDHEGNDGHILNNNAVPMPNIGSSILQSGSGSIGSAAGDMHLQQRS